MNTQSNRQIIAAIALLGLTTTAAVYFNNTLPKRSNKASSANTVAQNGNTFAIKNARIFDGEKIIERASVLVREGKIVAIGESIKIDDDITSYDGIGKTLMPGLIDSHTHTYGEAQKEALKFGVTTELDMFTDWKLIASAKQQRSSYAKTERADLWTAGTLATVPGGHGTEYGMKIPTLTQASEATPFVQQRLAEGSDYIKIVFDDGSAYGDSVKIKTLTPDTVQALVNATSAYGKQSIVHIASLNQAKQVANFGANGLAHIFIDAVADQEFIQVAKVKNLFIIPTLSVTASLAGAEAGKNLALDQQIKPLLSKQQAAALNSSFPTQWKNSIVLRNANQSIKLLHQAGISILAGTDAGNPGTTHGASMHAELELLSQAGMTPNSVLNSATALPAKIFGLTDRGRIAVGMRADMLLLNGNPIQDIRATRDIKMIWKNGFAVERLLKAEKSNSSTQAQLGMISDFEQAEIKSNYGQGWSINTDVMMNGSSSAKMNLIKGGANGSKSALEITGTITAEFAYPWAGVMFAPGIKASQSVDFSKAKEISFWAQGDGRTYNLMAFSSATMGAPPTQRFVADSNWQLVRFKLEEFNGLDRTDVTGFAINAGEPEGGFKLVIDELVIR